MTRERKEKIAFLCFLAASIGFYLSAIVGIFGRGEGNWGVSLCLGSAFLLLSTSHLHKSDPKEK